jgi:hypothetical protein
MEMQQVGVDTNHLRAQPRCPFYLDELISSGRPGMSEKVLTGDIARAALLGTISD